MKPFDALSEAERDREVLRALVRQARAGDHRARRYLGELLGIPIGRRVPSFDELLASVPRD
jgi:hypothetical protein